MFSHSRNEMSDLNELITKTRRNKQNLEGEIRFRRKKKEAKKEYIDIIKLLQIVRFLLISLVLDSRKMLTFIFHSHAGSVLIILCSCCCCCCCCVLVQFCLSYLRFSCILSFSLFLHFCSFHCGLFGSMN